ncbi:hypothetical protein XI25_15910 [Paenibacillus sp. DMB20]|nr:hypothetical protein XI25_15910 [Paenibacillus sp. DMB20]
MQKSEISEQPCEAKSVSSKTKNMQSLDIKVEIRNTYEKLQMDRRKQIRKIAKILAFRDIR